MSVTSRIRRWRICGLRLFYYYFILVTVILFYSRTLDLYKKRNRSSKVHHIPGLRYLTVDCRLFLLHPRTTVPVCSLPFDSSSDSVFLLLLLSKFVFTYSANMVATRVLTYGPPTTSSSSTSQLSILTGRRSFIFRASSTKSQSQSHANSLCICLVFIRL